jgi:hypothetical protein
MASGPTKGTVEGSETASGVRREKADIGFRVPVPVFKTRLTIGAKKPDASRARLPDGCFGTVFSTVVP